MHSTAIHRFPISATHTYRLAPLSPGDVTCVLSHLLPLRLFT